MFAYDTWKGKEETTNNTKIHWNGKSESNMYESCASMDVGSWKLEDDIHLCTCVSL